MMDPEAPTPPVDGTDGEPWPEPSGSAADAVVGSASNGEPATDALFREVYAELKRLARSVRAGRAGETLSTTALVHEAYLKLAVSTRIDWQGRVHFLGVAARAMRQVLADAARHRSRDKRGGGSWAVTLEEGDLAAPMRPAELLALDEALGRLTAMDERQAQVVEFRFFAGLTTEETAAVLGVSVPTVHRDWRAARAWLRREMRTYEAHDDS